MRCWCIVRDGEDEEEEEEFGDTTLESAAPPPLPHFPPPDGLRARAIFPLPGRARSGRRPVGTPHDGTLTQR